MRYGHTNLIANDWRALARFYAEVFDCVLLPPERDLSGPWLDTATGIPGARIRGAHLRLPGHGDKGPTLEIFAYDSADEMPLASGSAVTLPAPNQRGFGHIAFQVEDIAAVHRAVLAHGGSAVGKIVQTEIPGAGPLTWAYVRDPEGNIVEIQRWGV